MGNIFPTERQGPGPGVRQQDPMGRRQEAGSARQDQRSFQPGVLGTGDSETPLALGCAGSFPGSGFSTEEDAESQLFPSYR